MLARMFRVVGLLSILVGAGVSMAVTQQVVRDVPVGHGVTVRTTGGRSVMLRDARSISRENKIILFEALLLPRSLDDGTIQPSSVTLAGQPGRPDQLQIGNDSAWVYVKATEQGFESEQPPVVPPYWPIVIIQEGAETIDAGSEGTDFAAVRQSTNDPDIDVVYFMLMAGGPTSVAWLSTPELRQNGQREELTRADIGRTCISVLIHTDRQGHDVFGTPDRIRFDQDSEAKRIYEILEERVRGRGLAHSAKDRLFWNPGVEWQK